MVKGESEGRLPKGSKVYQVYKGSKQEYKVIEYYISMLGAKRGGYVVSNGEQEISVRYDLVDSGESEQGIRWESERIGGERQWETVSK